jgi:signal transduction histidine kinase/CheY-like chemotaxis protein
MLAEQLQLTSRQAARFPLPVMAADAFVAWLLWREDLAVVALCWFGLRQGLQLATTLAMRAMKRRLDTGLPAPTVLARDQRLTVLLFGAMGVSRAIVVPLLFMHPAGEVQYLFTMVCMGLAAAGVGNVGGQLRVYLAFALPLGAALALGWLLQRTTAASLVGVLLPGLFALLASFVREQGRSMQRIFGLVEEREQLAASLQREHDRAQSALAAKTHFLASASHDLRQPVTTIGLLVGLVTEAVHDARLKGMLMRITESVGALEELLRGLLDLSRLDSGTVTPARQTVRLGGLYTAVALHAQPVALAKGLRLRFRGDALGVRSDPVLLQQMLMNLVDNALRYTDRGGVLVSARRRGDGRVLLQVRDTGRGIAAPHQQTVFEEFVQLDNTERDRRKGLGLGLAIVKRSAALLDHALRLQSTPGRGSCFSITLPFEAIALPAMTALASIAEPPTLAGMRLWLLDDEPSVREALTARLMAWGAQVESFGRLAELEAGIARGLTAPHALHTDHRLPDGNGLQAIDSVRSQHGAIPALVLTGDTGPDELAQFRARGVPVLHKPFHHSELRALLAAWAPTPVAPR